MKNKTIIYYDFEATGVDRSADPISLGMVAVTKVYKIGSVENLIKDINQYIIDNFDVDLQEEVTTEQEVFDFLSEYNNHSFITSEDKFISGESYGRYMLRTFKFKDYDIVVKYLTNDSDYEEEFVSFEDIYLQEVSIKTFYSEFVDYDINKTDDWIVENIISKLHLKGSDYNIGNQHDNCWGDTETISKYVKQWLSQFDDPCFIADFDIIDKPMLVDLIADWEVKTSEYPEDGFGSWQEEKDWKPEYKVGLPKHLPNIRYDQFFDLHTMLWERGIDTDINREEFIGNLIDTIPKGEKHTALYDAYVLWKCHEKLNKM